MLLATGCWQSWLPRPEKQVRRGCWRLRGQLTSGGHLNSCLTNLGSYICWTNFLAKHLDSLFCSHINAVAQTESSRTKLWRVFMKKKTQSFCFTKKVIVTYPSQQTELAWFIFQNCRYGWSSSYENMQAVYHWYEWLDKNDKTITPELILFVAMRRAGLYRFPQRPEDFNFDRGNWDQLVLHQTCICRPTLSRWFAPLNRILWSQLQKRYIRLPKLVTWLSQYTPSRPPFKLPGPSSLKIHENRDPVFFSQIRYLFKL